MFIPAISGSINPSNKPKEAAFCFCQIREVSYPTFSRNRKTEYKFSTLISKDLTTNIVNHQCQYKPSTNAKNMKNEISEASKASVRAESRTRSD